MSNVTVIGTINDPELRFTQSGKPVLGFSLAQNHRKKDQSGEWQDDGTTWRKVTVWDKKAEVLAEHLSKGARVIVTGEERIREFEKRDGTKGQSLELNAREVGIVPKLNQSGGYQQQSGAGAYNQEHAPTAPQSDPWGASNTQVNEPPF